MKFNFKALGTRVGGAAAGGAASFLADKALPKMDSKLKALLKAAVGAVVPELFPKSKIVDYAGAGLVGAAADNIIKDMTASSTTDTTSGVAGDDQFSEDQFVVDNDAAGVNGDDETISGNDDVATLSGMDVEVQ